MAGGPYRFNARLADAACAWIERHCVHTEAQWAGQPFKLAAWQRNDIVRPLFGTVRADGTRRYRRAYIEVARKNGKTELAAAIGLALTAADGEPGGQVYSAAVNADQAKICFNKAGVMVNLSPSLTRELQVYKTSVFCPALGSSFKPLASGPKSKHGFSPSGAIYDEIHEWPDGELANVIHQGTGARRQPLEVYITTAGVFGRGFGWEMHEHACKVRDGLVEDDELLVVIYAADADDDWTDPEVWKKANPNLGISIKLEYLESECRQARGNPRKENAFRRFHLNQWTEQAERWLSMLDWKACSGDDTWREIEAMVAGWTCCGGLDLSTTTDLTACVWTFPPQIDEFWRFVFRFWLPEARLTLREERKDGVPFSRWRDEGALIVTPGSIIDYAAVRRQIMADAARYRVQKLAIDRWNASQIAVELQDDGAPVEFFGQGFASMSAPAKELERIVTGHLVRHGGHPVAHWQAGNAVITEDSAGNIKPAKDRAVDRIDGVVAEIMGIGMVLARPANPPSVYERDGLVVI